MNLREYLEQQIDESLSQAVLSGSRREGIGTVKIRPVQMRGQVLYQASATKGQKILHTNYEKEGLISYVEKALADNFRQFQAKGRTMDGTVLVSKKGKITVKSRYHRATEPVSIQAHNRVKRYILKEGVPVPFLIDLGVMNQEGKVISSRYDKFRQINRFLEFIEDVLPQLPKERELTILDFGCGKSYLTFAMYYYLRILQGYDVRIIGLDLKEDVIERCSFLAEKYGYEKLRFQKGDIAAYEGVSAVDLVVSLHACDTATDYALARAVEWGARVILSVPCCQHELNRQIHNETLEPVLKYGILKERMAALFTDGIRAGLLEEAGYETQILEFIDMEHTPKNLLIRAVWTGKKSDGSRLRKMMEDLQVRPTLDALLHRSAEGGTEG